MTRLISRVGYGPATGVDRVEMAYLQQVLSQGTPDARYFCRTTRGYLLLDARGAEVLLNLVRDEALPGPADRMSRILRRGDDLRHRTEAMLRPLAVARAAPWRLARLLSRARAPFTYLNVGHSNLSDRTLSAFAAHSDARTVVMVHDLIPIRHPEFSSEGMPAMFARRIERVRMLADVVLCNSKSTCDDLSAYWSGADRQPNRCVAPLGLAPRAVPKDRRDPKSFVMLGTIEPRKNLGLMLDVWDRLSERTPLSQMPHLHIIGRTGWSVDKVMARLKAHPLNGTVIFPHGVLPDAQVDRHLARANALLFPSLAEGFGYPPLEAALAGALPICSDLPVFRETLGESAVYLDPRDVYAWSETINQRLLGLLTEPDMSGLQRPTWKRHFETVKAALTVD